ncbi:alpha-N-acetylglucosaminidase [Kitasatospora sp. NPDC057015]|uniref:alpha-N-acetylglucosaminidase n=1 Tax=Kitasatospora sp. NPDC057015 TaxID=3346001 RepID=UPI00363BCB8B
MRPHPRRRPGPPTDAPVAAVGRTGGRARAARAAVVVLAVLTVLATSGGLGPAAASDRKAAPRDSTRAAPPFDTAPALAALGRLLPAHAAQFSLTPVPKDTGADSYSVSGTAGSIAVRGTSPAALLTGVGWYLAEVAGVDIGLPGDSTAALPAVLPAVPSPVTRAAVVPHRYALNDTDAGYSGAYRDFAAHQREIDVLALHGVNEVFVQTGAEYPYYRALQEFGYSPAELRDWIPAPAHQSWWLLQNMSGFGGPVSEQLMLARVALGRQIADRLRSLGMTPVLPGYFGTVPAGFAARNRTARTVPQGDWVGFTRPDWLDPTGPVFTRLAASYYRAQREAFGDSTMYKMDLLHEGGTAGPVDVSAAANAVQHALLTAHPEATWAILGWQDNPSGALLAGVDTSRMLILDGLSDRYEGLDRDADWRGTPYAFGSIANFGGHTTIGANAGVWAERIRQWLARPGSALRGIAYLPEGTGTDPAAFDLLTRLAWQGAPTDLAGWSAGYPARRFGGADPHAAAAWDALRRGPYGMPSDSWSETQDSLFTARPSLTVTSAASWSPPAIRYDPALVRRALDELLAVAPALRSTDAYRFDLVNLARQALADHGRDLLPRIGDAYRDGDLSLFRRLTAQWRDDLGLLDRLLGSDRRFMLGPWVADARAQGATPAERDRLEYDARSILTTWGSRGPSDGGGLHDYAAREWSGLVSGLYAERWALFFASLDTALSTGRAPAPIDWFALDDGWARRTDPLPTAPAVDPVELARAVATAARPA